MYFLLRVDPTVNCTSFLSKLLLSSSSSLGMQFIYKENWSFLLLYMLIDRLVYIFLKIRNSLGGKGIKKKGIKRRRLLGQFFSLNISGTIVLLFKKHNKQTNKKREEERRNLSVLSDLSLSCEEN